MTLKRGVLIVVFLIMIINISILTEAKLCTNPSDLSYQCSSSEKCSNGNCVAKTCEEMGTCPTGGGDDGGGGDAGSGSTPTCSSMGYSCGGSATSGCDNGCSSSNHINAGACNTCISKPCTGGSCNPRKGESCLTCSNDCGSCTINAYPVCGNNNCETNKGESCGTCPGDCGTCEIVTGYSYCGDGIHDSGETYPGCRDAFNPSTSVLLNPKQETGLYAPEIFNNPNWLNIYTEYVPTEDIHLIPPTKIDVEKVVNLPFLVPR
jgi:hypothetical protein